MALKIAIYPTPLEVATAAADCIREKAHEAVRRKGYFTLVFSGGRTPNLLYKLLATAPYANTLPWDQIFCFWGDERYVPATHRDSNYGGAMTYLLSQVPIPARNVYPMLTMAPNPAVAAHLYEQSIRQAFGELGCQGFDLALLGMGSDGHTASIFPGSEAVKEQKRWVLPVKGPNGQSRLTLTLPLLNSSQQLLFLVTGEEKCGMLEKVLDDNQKDEASYPAALVQGRSDTLWFVDQEAFPRPCKSMGL